MRIAFLEDDLAQAEVVSEWLQTAGHSCRHFTQAQAFIKDARRESYDLLILDWELPESSGIEVLEWVRQHFDWPIPVLFVTNRDSEQDIVLALEKGADDYITKPPSRQVTLARIAALARRGRNAGDELEAVTFGAFCFDRAENTLTRDSRPIELTDKEYQLALMLFSNAGRLLSRDHMLESVWGVGPGLATRTVDTHISRLRRKMALVAENGWRLKAVYQHGYRLEAVPAPDAAHQGGA